MSNKQGDKKRLAGIAFTAVMAICCLLLYLFGGGSGAENSAEPATAEQPKLRAYPAVEVFFDRAEEYGFSAVCTPVEGYAPSTAYSLKRPELADAVLVLSMKNGGVCAFTLIVPQSKAPGAMPNDPTAVELSLYEQRLAACELEQAWVEDNFGALLNASDIMRKLTYADQSSMLSLIWQTTQDGKARDMKAGGFAFSVNAAEDAGQATVSASVVAEDQN